MKKNLYTLLLALAVSTSAVQAQQYDFKEGQLFYKITDAAAKTVSVVSEVKKRALKPAYSSEDTKPTGDIIISEKIIHNGIEYTVTSIGIYAFYECKLIKSVIIQAPIERINEATFSKCESMTSVTLPSSLKEIDDHAFYSCQNLASITIPPSVSIMGDLCFDQCSGLTVITIPPSVSTLGKNPFRYCTKLASITVDETNKNFKSLNGVLFNKDATLLFRYPEAHPETAYSIPASVTKIGDEAFFNCKKLTSISIPNTVTHIGYHSFYYCNGLTSLTIPSSVTTIAQYAFSYCHGLKSLTIPNSVTTIGGGAFGYCYGLSAVNSAIVEPGNVTIGNNIFDQVNKGSVLGACTLYVPIGSKEKYAAANQWKDFMPNIIEKDMSENYPLYVAGTQVTSANASNITGTGISGKVSYNHTTKTLTLDNAKITSVYSIRDGYNVKNLGIYATEDIKINLVGSNSINLQETDPSGYDYWEVSGIKSEKNITFNGNGKLLVDVVAKGRDNDSYVYSYGVWAGEGVISILDKTSLEVSTKPMTDNFVQCAALVTDYDISVTIGSGKEIKEGKDKASGVIVSNLYMQDNTAQNYSKQYVNIYPIGTGLATLHSQGIQVRGGKGEIIIQTDLPSNPSAEGELSERTVNVYDLSGALMHTSLLPADFVGQLTLTPLSGGWGAGVYIVRIGNGAEKVVVHP